MDHENTRFNKMRLRKYLLDFYPNIQHTPINFVHTFEIIFRLRNLFYNQLLQGLFKLSQFYPREISHKKAIRGVVTCKWICLITKYTDLISIMRHKSIFAEITKFIVYTLWAWDIMGIWKWVGRYP